MEPNETRPLGHLSIPTSVSEQAQQWLAFSAPKAEYPAPADVDGWLALINATDQVLAERFAPALQAVDIERHVLGNVTVYIADSASHERSPIYLDFHGGGLIFGAGAACRAYTAVTAATVGRTVWGVDYRMPPIHPYPAAVDDAIAVYRAALEQRAPSEIVVGGASAGGNIAASLLLRAKDEGLPMPAALVLITPEVDLTESGESFQTNSGVDNILGSLLPVNHLYAGDIDLAHPYVSPLFGDLTDFPPTFLQSGTRDLFLSNTVRMHRALRSAGVPAELHIFEAMPHGGFGGSPEDEEVAAEQRRFLDRHLPQQRPEGS